MAQKLWEKNVQVDHEVDIFTVGHDREMDLYLAKYDVLGSMAHIKMLESVGLLQLDELKLLLAELKNIYQMADNGKFVIEDGIEDVHSQVELMLTRKLGDIGKKIHRVRKVFAPMERRKKELEAAAQALETDYSEEAVTRYTAMEEKFKEDGGYYFEKE